MAQSLFASPASRSPVPKRFRLSLKPERLHCQESSELSKKLCSVDFSIKKEDIPSDNLTVQNENISPNCKKPESRLSVFVNPSVVNYDEDIEAVGLPNCGNTCFANSIVQVLRYTPNFMICVHSLLSSHKWLSMVSPNCQETEETSFFTQLHLLFIAMKKQEDYLFKNSGNNSYFQLLHQTESFLDGLRKVSSSFEEGEQHDAHELLMSILCTFTDVKNSIENDMVNHCRNQGSAFVPEISLPLDGLLSTPQPKDKRKLKKGLRRNSKALSVEKIPAEKYVSSPTLDVGFEGKMRRFVKCLECENKSGTDESFRILEICATEDLVDEGFISLLDCLPQRSLLSGENKYSCEDCNHLNEAEISYEITSLPSTLIIHCSWLVGQSSYTQSEKESTNLLIPMSIEMSESRFFPSFSNDIYHLYAVVLHLGTSTEYGHYVSFVKDRPKPSELVKSECNASLDNCCASEEILNLKLSSKSRWLLFDDKKVCPIYVNEESDNFPYYKFLQIAASPSILFYYKT